MIEATSRSFRLHIQVLLQLACRCGLDHARIVLLDPLKCECSPYGALSMACSRGRMMKHTLREAALDDMIPANTFIISELTPYW
jgi:hypothetical protein